jgi:hypothetical protein
MSEDKIVDFKKAREELEKNIISVEKLYDAQIAKLEELNKKHSFIESVGGKPVVTNYIYNDAVKSEIMEYISPINFQTIYCNQSVEIDGKPKELGKWWIGHKDRKTYKTVIFDPSKPREFNDNLNIWEGFKTKPEKKLNSWRYTLRHIYFILCNKDKTKFKYVMRWFAWCVQNPGKRAEVAIIFKGKQGAGKGFIFTQFVHMFGLHGMSIANRELLTGKHNGHFSKIVFLFADEAYYPGDKEVEGVMKQLITEPNIAYRAMYMDPVMGVNRLHIGMATNSDWVIPDTKDSRRYFINEVDNKYAKGSINDLHRNLYFSNLWQEMKHGGREGMLYDLLNMKLNGWHPRDAIPSTEESNRQKHLSLSKLQSVLFSILDDGVFPGLRDNRTRYVATAEEIYKFMDKKDIGAMKFSEVKKSEVIKSIGAEKERYKDGIRWIFPELGDARRKWNEVYTEQKWNLNDTWQVVKTMY